MLKGVHKIKFRKGRDANRSLIKKSVADFIRYGKMEVSVKKAKVLKAVIDRLVHKAQRNTNADKNMLLRAIGDKRLITVLTNEIAPKFTDRTSGFVKTQRLGRRLGDGAEIARIEWVITVPTANKVTTKDTTVQPVEKDASAKTEVDQSTKKQPVAPRAQSKKVGNRMAGAQIVNKPSAVKKRGDK